MTTFLLYLSKTAIAYIICFFVYWLLFRKETFFKRNRYYLLISLLIPAILPLIQFAEDSPVRELVSGQGLNWVLILGNNIVDKSSTVEIDGVINKIGIGSNISISSMLMILYFTGLLFFITRIIVNYSKILKLIYHAKKSRINNVILAFTQRRISPFSFFKWLVIPEYKRKHQDFNKILKHEMIHCKQNHSYDLLLSELLIAFQWFNPCAWMIKSAIIRNNEFIVDKEFLSDNIAIKDYQYSLLANSIGEQKLSMVNNFNKNLIKKRIKMMNKKRTPMINAMKNVIILPFILLLMILFSAYSNKLELSPEKMESAPDPYFLSEDYVQKKNDDQDKKKKGTTIYINGKSVTIKDLSGIDTKGGQIQIINLNEPGKLKGLFSNEKIAKLIENLNVGDEEIYLMLKSDGEDEDSSNSMVGALLTIKEGDDKSNILYFENLDDEINIYTGEDKSKSIFFSKKGNKDNVIIFSVDEEDAMYYSVDGKKISLEELKELKSDDIETITILKSEEAMKEFGDEGKSGAIKIKTKK